jgi:hypothetical protein
MISAAEQHVLGWPLPASAVERTESMRNRVAMFISAGTRTDVCTDNDALRSKVQVQRAGVVHVHCALLHVEREL